MNCCNCRKVRALSVVTTVGTNETYLTITVPTDTDLESIGCLDICIFTSVPNTVSCARLVVTNTTTNLNVLMDNGNYYRPCKLKCRSILRTYLLSDPPHLLIKKGE